MSPTDPHTQDHSYVHHETRTSLGRNLTLSGLATRTLLAPQPSLGALLLGDSGVTLTYTYKRAKKWMKNTFALVNLEAPHIYFKYKP